MCKLAASTEEGSKTYVVDKIRVSIRLISPCSEERRIQMKTVANVTFKKEIAGQSIDNALRK